MSAAAKTCPSAHRHAAGPRAGCPAGFHRMTAPRLRASCFEGLPSATMAGLAHGSASPAADVSGAAETNQLLSVFRDGGGRAVAVHRQCRPGPIGSARESPSNGPPATALAATAGANVSRLRPPQPPPLRRAPASRADFAARRAAARAEPRRDAPALAAVITRMAAAPQTFDDTGGCRSARRAPAVFAQRIPCHRQPPALPHRPAPSRPAGRRSLLERPGPEGGPGSCSSAAARTG